MKNKPQAFLRSARGIGGALSRLAGIRSPLGRFRPFGPFSLGFFLVGLFLSFTASAAVVCEMSGEAGLDLREGTRYARLEEPIAFSTDWGTNVTRLVLKKGNETILTSEVATNGVYVWKPDFTTVSTVTFKHTMRGTVNEALTATFTVEAFDVTFEPGEHGTLNGNIAANQRVPHGSDAAVPAVIPAEGYQFMGWNVATTNVTSDITVTAQYEPIAYTITYEDLHSATHANPTSYTIEDTVTFTDPDPIPRRQFIRWEPAEIAKGSTGNQTVCAVWELTPYVYVDAVNGDDANNGSTAALAVETLECAYSLAEEGDIICVAAGMYAPVTAIGKPVTFRATDGATIDGGGTARCVTADEGVVFEQFTLQNGYDADVGGGAKGGTFENCTITNCVSEWDGGGAYGSILRNCVIVDNRAENGYGGGAYCGTLVNCQVLDNEAGDIGGGVYAPEAMTNVIFRGNYPEDLAGGSTTVAEGGTIAYAPAESETAYTMAHDWFVTKGLAKYGDTAADLSVQLATTQANGYTGWESYVAGLDPTNSASVFAATVTISNGMVYVSWTPNLNDGETNRIYVLSGREKLESGDWETPAQPWHRFFKVTVAMPTGSVGEETAVAGEGFVPLDEKPLGGVQLWENGPYWAECNVGASKPEEYGYYFWWGDTVGYKRSGGTWTSSYYYSDVTWVSSAGTNMSSSQFDSSTCPTYNKGDSALQSLGYIDSTSNLVATHDAATAHLGEPWRMPTSSEIYALICNCDTTWTTTNGVYGRLVTGRGAYSSKSIFLPAAGYGNGSSLYRTGSYGFYWSSSPDLVYFYDAWSICFDSGSFSRSGNCRDYGHSVRPLRDCAQ